MAANNIIICVNKSDIDELRSLLNNAVNLLDKSKYYVATENPKLCKEITSFLTNILKQ